ncbi:hypothetical protein CRU87_10935, partial [Aliarcobacter trophiarum LMG 25534]
ELKAELAKVEGKAKKIKNEQEAKEIEASQWEAAKQEDKVALETLAKNGVIVNEASQELKTQLDKIADELLKEYLSDANSQIKKIFEEYRK